MKTSLQSQKQSVRHPSVSHQSGGSTGMNIPAFLVLSDGTIFDGFLFGAMLEVPVVGEVVFNTSMYGYQEILTDPSYRGQMICFTCSHIGNVGWNSDDYESGQIQASGVLIRDLTKITSNYRSELNFTSALEKEGVSALYGIDTRTLVVHLRDQGAQMGAFGPKSLFSPEDLLRAARTEGSMLGKDYVKEVTPKSAYVWSERGGNFNSSRGSNFSDHSSSRFLSQEELLARPHVVVIDCGTKRNILRLLIDVGFRVTVLPAIPHYELPSGAAHNTDQEAQIRALKPDGIFISNGPGDPATLDYIVKPVEALLGKIPMFGICLGHQILAQALGAKTYKLKFGHRGANHPVKELATGKVEITVQNHGFAVDERTLKPGTIVTHVNLNDQTIEGIAHPELKAFAVQYHPEASAGPHDSRYLFKRFFDLVTGT